jgi:hypothetical protein
MLEILESSGGTISTKMACDVACQLATGLFQPLTAQLDPQRMGEMERMMTIAKAYGERLGKENLKDGALQKLIEEYPSHSFIIDYVEAKGLFKKVSKVVTYELSVVFNLSQQLERGTCVFVPTDDIIVFDVSSLSTEEGEGGENEAAETSAPDFGPDDPREPAEASKEGKDISADPSGRAKRGRRVRKAAPSRGETDSAN